MADLLDIAPATSVEVIIIDGKHLKVRGLSFNAIASIVARFPELRKLLDGIGSSNITPRLIEQFGASIGPIIAAGIGHLGEKEYEERGAQLLIEHQFKIVASIVGLTFPNGISSFVEMVATVFIGMDERAKPIKVRLRKPHSASPPLSDAASRPAMQ